MHHHHHHVHRPTTPNYHPPPHHHHHIPPPPPPAPPPPPPPPEALREGQEGGPARCYFCGHAMAEADVQKTDYHIGHGHHIRVMICPACRGLKERGEGPFAPKPFPSGVLAVLGVFVVMAVGSILLWFIASGGSIPGRPARTVTNPDGTWTAEQGGLKLTVTRIETTGAGFRVHLKATNNTRDSLALPLFGYFFVVDQNGTQYEADPFASTFPHEVAPGATASGYAQMKSPLKASSTRVKVGFSTVFGSFAVDSIWVEGIPIQGETSATRGLTAGRR